jgi:hypothetical protein
MDDQLLNDLYGINPQDHADDSMIKAAQAELVEAVADEAGVDLAEMDDVELDKFASYVLSDASDDVYTDPSLAEADQMGRVMAHAYADEQMKIAHQLEGQYLTQGDNIMYDDLDYALEKQAHAWDLVKEASEFKDMSAYQRIQESKGRKGMDGLREGGTATGSRGAYLRSLAGRGTGFYDIKRGRAIGKDIKDTLGNYTKDKVKAMSKEFRGKEYKDFAKGITSNTKKNLRKAIIRNDYEAAQAILAGMGGTAEQKAMYAIQQGKKAKRGLYMRGAGKAGLVAGGLGLAGYGASRAMSKKSSYDPVVGMVEDLDGWEFAKEAELRAAEILLENGIDPETFEDTYPESVKLASFPEPGDAYTHEGDYELAEYNEMLDDAAYDILEDLGF